MSSDASAAPAAPAAYDVAIAGAGVAGLTFACSLRRSRVALIARAVPPRADDVPGLDSRVYAISPGNAAHLDRIGVWQRIPESLRTPVYGMRVYGDDGRATLAFDAYEGGVQAIAWIVEDRRLQGALWDTLAARGAVEVVAPAEAEKLEVDEAAAILRLRCERRISARLVVGADGARSLVRSRAGIGVRERDYGQCAVVANFACGHSHRNLAWQWFFGGQVLALLPLPGNFVSMVWSVDDANAARMLRLDPEELAREAAGAARGELGALRPAGQAHGFALHRLRAAQIASRRVALLGDAAHVIHPLAGQGMNLGMQDARSLAQIISSREPGRDAGDAGLLRRYQRARAEDTMLMDMTVHGLFGLFAHKGTFARRVRNAGLDLTNRLPLVKNLLLRQAMN